jgi:hypothetical protein
VTAAEVVTRQPDLIIGSWSGEKFRPERVAARPGFAQTLAAQYQAIYEIKSSLILQPGPAALTDGLNRFRPPLPHAEPDLLLPKTPQRDDPGLATTWNPGNVGLNESAPRQAAKSFAMEKTFSPSKRKSRSC